MAITLERLLILGLDGATWTVLDPMMRRGLMPNLSALTACAARGVLRSTIPPVTSAAWTTMMTGCSPARHGIFDHRCYDAAADRMKVNNASRVRVPTVWHQVAKRQGPIISLNLPMTYPPLDVPGVVVSGMDAPHLEAALSGSAEFAAKLRREAPDYGLKYFWKRAPRALEELVSNASGTVQSFLGRARGGLVADRFVPDWATMMVQFQNLDPFQHRVWRYLNVDETGLDAPAWNKAAWSVLKGLDEAIGMLLDLAARRDAGVLIVSDHGFGACRGRVHVNRVLIDAGVARTPGAWGRTSRRMSQAVDHVRLFNAKRGDPGARSSSFDLSVRAQFPFDWKRTLAFAPHQDTAAMIYLNSKSRRGPAGSPREAPIQTDAQLDSARVETVAALAAARHPETGRRLFPTIIEAASAYGVDPAREGYPDVIALPDEDYWVRTKLTAGRGWIEPDDNLPGTHRPEGVIALAGAGVDPSTSIDARLEDAAPTILKLLNLPIPAYMEGKPLDCLSDLPTTRLDPADAGIPAPHRANVEYTPEEQAIIEQRLADLGYLE